MEVQILIVDDYPAMRSFIPASWKLSANSPTLTMCATPAVISTAHRPAAAFDRGVRLYRWSFRTSHE